jgi:hypothetical protein
MRHWPCRPSYGACLGRATEIHLAHVAEAGVAQRNVAAPQSGVAKFFGASGQAFLAEHRRLVAGESLDREEHTERQPIRRKHPLKAFGIAWPGRPVNCQHVCHDLSPKTESKAT